MEKVVQKKTYQYDAFISYSRKDKIFAEKLQKALENFNPPKDLPIPQRRLKIFRDENDLIGADYNESIDDHLGDSAKLIVICSPNARKSEFVNDEIRRFFKQNTSTNIIPIIIDGLPNNEVKKGMENEKAFPDALCEALEMPLAVSYVGIDLQKEKVNKGIYDGSWYTVLANMYNLSRGEIEQRDKKKQQRRRRIIIGITSGVMLALLSLAIIALWQRNEARRKELTSRHLAYASDFNLAEYSLAELDAKRVHELLERQRTDLRDFAWYYLWRRYHGNRWSLPVSNDAGTWSSGGGVGALAISPDSKVLAATRKDISTVTLWDALTGQQRPLIQTHEYEDVNALDFVLGGKLLVTASDDKTVKLWDTATGTEQGTLPHDAPVVGLRVSPDGGSLFTITRDDYSMTPFRLWDLKTREQRNPLEDLKGPYGQGSLSSYSFAPDSKTLALGYERGLVILVDVLRAQERARLESTRDWRLADIAFSPNGKTLALGFSGKNNEVRLWDMVNNRETLTLPVIEASDNEGSELISLAFAPDGKTLAFMSGDPDIVFPKQSSELRVFDVSGKERFTLKEAQTGFVTTFAFSPDGKTLATGGKDHSVLVWDIVTGSLISSVGLHTGIISHLKFFPDGKTLVSAGRDLQVKVWDMTVKDYFEVPQRRDFHNSISFSPDSTTAAVGGGDGSITLWNLSSFEKIMAFQAHAAKLHNIVFGPEGAKLASESADGSLKVWDAASGAQLVSFTGHRFRGPPIDVGGLFYDGNRLISAPRSTRARRLEPPATIEWDLATGKRTNSVRGSAFSVFVLAETGKVAASAGGYDDGSGSYEIKLWHLDTGREQQLESREGINITHLALSRDARFLAAAGPAVTFRTEGGKQVDVSGVRLFDVATGKERHILPVPITYNTARSLASLSFSYDGNMLAIAASVLIDKDGKKVFSPKPVVTLWNVQSGKKLHTLFYESEQVCVSGQGSSCFQSAIFSPDGRTLATLTNYQTPGSSGSSKTGIFKSWGGYEVVLWDVDTGKERQKLHFNEHVEAIVFSPDSRSLAAIMPDSPVTLWDVETGSHIASLGEREALITSMTLADNGQMLALTRQKSIDGYIYKAWNMASDEVMLTIGPDSYREGASLKSVAISPDGKKVFGSFSDQSVVLWDLATGKSEEIMKGQILSSGKYPTPFSPDGKMLITSNEERLTVWDMTGFKALQSFPVSSNAILSTNGKLLATNEEGIIAVWEVRTGKKKLLLKGFGSSVKPLGFSTDSKLLVTGEGGHGEGSFTGSKIKIKVWNLNTGKQQAILSGYEGTAYPSVAFSPDARTLATGGKTVNLWDPLTGRRFLRLKNESGSGRIVYLAFNAKGKMLVAGFQNGIRLWHAATMEQQQ